MPLTGTEPPRCMLCAGQEPGGGSLTCHTDLPLHNHFKGRNIHCRWLRFCFHAVKVQYWLHFFFFFPMKVEYLLWCHNSSTWRFKKKKYIGHYSSTSKWSLIFQPQCSLCIMIPHFLHLCSWSLPNSGFVFLIFGSLWPDLSSDHLLFYINQKISACEYVLSRD